MHEVQHPRTDDEVRAAVAGQTVPTLFRATVAARGPEVALRWKKLDDWSTWTWNDYADHATRTASWLRRAGIGSGDRVALMLRNRPEFHPIDMGAYLVGAVPFSIYNSSAPEQIEYLLRHSEAKVVFADPDLAKTVAAVASDLPDVGEVVVVADGGDISEQPAWLDLITSVEPLDLDTTAGQAQPEDTATLIYTSGTTGPPKAVMLSHRNICWLLESLIDSMGFSMAGRRMLSYLPMAHVAERLFTHYLPARVGAVVTPCPDPAAVGAYLPDVRPEAFFGPPRVFEKMRSGLLAALGAKPESANALEQGLMIGRRRFEAQVAGEKPTAETDAAWAAIDETLFAGVRATIGLDACRLALTGAAPPPVEVIEFFNFIGIRLAEVYGLSEDTGLMTTEMERPRAGSVGRPIPGCTIRLLDDGEILCRGGHVFQGYFKDPEKTAEVLDTDGWLHSGDIGTIDDDGFITIVDRKKELIITAGGKNISPANIEAKLKQLPLVAQACAIGDRRPYVTAVLVLDPEPAAAWAAQHGLTEFSLEELAAHPALLDEVEQGVDEMNQGLSNVERVKKFLLVGDEWLPDTALLTPTMKLKRRGVLELYGQRLDELYEG